MRYRCIHRRRSQYPVSMMCRVLKVSRSGFYAWRVRPESQRSKTDRQLTEVIRGLHTDSKGIYGSPKITADLRDEGYRHGRHKVARLMRLAGLKGCPKRRFRVTTQRDPSHPVAENLLDQDFTAEAPNQRWAADITFIATNQGWLYLAVVMDLYSRRIVGWSMSRWINRHLVIDALNMAIGARRPGAELGKPKISGPLILLGIPVVDSYFLQSSTARTALDSCRPMSHAAGWCCIPPAIA